MKNNLKRLSILFLFSLFLLSTPNISLAESTVFSSQLQTINNPDGETSEISKTINLSETSDYEVKVYYRSDSGTSQLYEEFNIYLNNTLIGTATDPNQGDDFEEKNLGIKNFTSGNHTLKVQHAYTYSDKGDQSVYPLEVVFTSQNTNSSPTADAGSNKEVFENNSVTLSGSANDPDGDSLTYDWTCNGGSLSSSNTLTPGFNAPSVSQDTTFICTLTAEDSSGAEDSDNVNILVKNQTQDSNNAPTANAGSDKETYENTSVTLSGSANDPDGDSLSYDWTCNGGSLSSSNTLTPGFNAPSVSSNTTYICTLEVTDSEGLSASNNVNILVRNISSNSNNYPFNNAGPSKQVNEGEQVMLNGSASDPDGDSLTHNWSCSNGSLSNQFSLSPTFFAPQVPNDRHYSCTLRTTDSRGLSASDNVSILVIDTDNSQSVSNPTVSTRSADDVGINSAQLRGYLDDKGGYYNTEVWFEWGETSNSYRNTTSKMTRNRTGEFTWNLNNLDDNTRYYFRAVASNGSGNDFGFGSNFTTDNRIEDNESPIVSAGNNKEIFENQYTVLNGSASDPDGSIVSKRWNCTEGSVNNPTAYNATLTSPFVNANIVIECIFSATDNDGQSSSDSMTVLVKNRTSGTFVPTPAPTQEDEFVTIEKSARNLTRNNVQWNSEEISASFFDEVEFRIRISSISDNVITNIKIRDNIPSDLIYQNNLTIDDESNLTDITEEAIDIDSLSPGETKIIKFSTKINSDESFINDPIDLLNVATISNEDFSDFDTVNIEIRERNQFFTAFLGGIFGQYFNISLGDLFLLLLLILILIGIYASVIWLQKIKKEEKSA